MKTLLTLFFVSAISFAVAQSTLEAPRTEFNLALSESSLSLKPGTTKTVMLSIARSKSFSKQKAKLGVLSALPEGITVTYEPSSGLFDNTIATIAIAPEVPVGEYQIVLSAELATKKKGSILKLNVGTADSLMANQ